MRILDCDSLIHEARYVRNDIDFVRQAWYHDIYLILTAENIGRMKQDNRPKLFPSVDQLVNIVKIMSPASMYGTTRDGPDNWKYTTHLFSSRRLTR